MQPNKLVNLLGAAAIIIGVFSPLFTVPFIGSISYAGQMQGEGFLIAGAALVSGLLALTANIYWPSIIAALIVLIDIGMTLNNIHERMSQFTNNDNPFVQVFARSISPSFGFAFLGLGAVMLIVSVFLQKKKTEPVWDKTAVYGKLDEPLATRLSVPEESGHISLEGTSGEKPKLRK